MAEWQVVGVSMLDCHDLFVSLTASLPVQPCCLHTFPSMYLSFWIVMSGQNDRILLNYTSMSFSLDTSWVTSGNQTWLAGKSKNEWSFIARKIIDQWSIFQPCLMKPQSNHPPNSSVCPGGEASPVGRSCSAPATGSCPQWRRWHNVARWQPGRSDLAPA